VLYHIAPHCTVLIFTLFHSSLLYCTQFYCTSLLPTLLYYAVTITVPRSFLCLTMPLFATSTHFVSYDDIQFSSPRMMMQHWMSWQEIIAQAYLFEEKSIGKKKHNRSSSTPASPVQKRKKRFVSDLDSSLVSRTMLLR
jgi:hypothetical protein